MDPLTMLTVGSAAVRLVGGLFGGKTKAVTDKVAGFVDEAAGLPRDQAVADVTRKMADLPPEDFVELRKCDVKLKEIAADLDKAKMQAESDRHAESQETIRAQVASTDEYVRRTRPKMARRSFNAGTIYIVGSELLKAFGYGDGASVELAGMLYSASLFYTTMRSAESFSKHGKSASGSGVKDLIGAGVKLFRK